MAQPTVYKNVGYVGKGTGTLKLYEEQLTFSMFDRTAANNTKIFTLPWKKVARRQVTTSDSTPAAKIKLILKSGNEAVFQTDDRVGLEVLRDDVAERLARYKARYPDSDEEAVNKVRGAAATKRESQPYRMAAPKAAPNPTAKREGQPYRMAQTPATTSTKTTPAARRESTPYRMAQKTTTPAARRESTPYRMAKK